MTGRDDAPLPVTLPEALRALSSGPPAGRRAALEVIATQGDVRLTAAVAACLHDEDADLVERAEATLWQLWSRAPDPDVARRFKDGLRLLAARDWLGAVTVFAEVVERAPTFAEGWNKRATARYMAEHYASAIADCQEVVRLVPQHFGALSGQGLCHLALGQRGEAAACFRRALLIHPRLDEIRGRLARIQLDQVQGNGH